MKVKNLIELLSSYDPELTVAVAKDEEGNGFHELDTTSLEVMDTTRYQFDLVYFEDDEEEPVELGDGIEHVLVLWP